MSPAFEGALPFGLRHAGDRIGLAIRFSLVLIPPPGDAQFGLDGRGRRRIERDLAEVVADAGIHGPRRRWARLMGTLGFVYGVVLEKV